MKGEVEKSLYSWISRQRHLYHHLKENPFHCLSKDRVERLTKLGFVWNIYASKKEVDCFYDKDGERRWNIFFHELKKFKIKYGCVDVNVMHATGYNELAEWVNLQCQNHNDIGLGKASPLLREQIVALNSVGFKWDSNEKQTNIDDDWLKNYEELKEFKSSTGHCNVPSCNEYAKLREWVTTQKKLIELLGNLGLTPTSILKEPQSREVRISELKAYRAEFGDCLVPKRWARNPRLGQWVSEQRRQYKNLMAGKSSYMTQEVCLAPSF